MKSNSVFFALTAAGLLVVWGCHSKAEKEAKAEPMAALPASAAPPRPLTATNEYHGVQVVDPFRWLEDGADPAVREWTADQNKKARAHLDGLADRPWIQDRLTRLLIDAGADYSSLVWRRGTLFALKTQAPAEQAVLVALRSYTNLLSERVILDPARLQTNGSLSIDWYVPSLDGKWVALSLSENGSEEGTLRVFASSDGKAREDVIPRVQAATAGGSAAWNAEGNGFFYTRYPRSGERREGEMHFYQQIYFHRLGSNPDEDTYELGKEFPRIAEVKLKSSPDGQRILASVANGDGGDYAHFLREPSGVWRVVAGFADQVRQVEFGRDPLYVEWGADRAVYLLSHKGASRGQLLRLPFAATDLAGASTVLAEGKQVIESFQPSASGLALAFLNGGPMEFAFLDYFENRIRKVEERTPTAVQEIVVMDGDEILYRIESYTQPYEWLHYSANRRRDRVESTALAGSSPVSFSDVEVVREKVTSGDGTVVPLNILRRRGTRLTGSNPVLLNGYGGFGISESPRFDVSRRLWLDQGGLFAFANLRGGREYGEAWHTGGALTNKPNVFADFLACAKFLVQSNYASSATLAIRGGSNGGLLMGAALTQHPDWFRAVVSQVGLYDMLRAELHPNGAFNTTEYGTVTDANQFQVLHGYSPYQRVQAKMALPAVLLLTGENDGRVDPAHSRKMAARLLAANTSTNAVLLRTSSSGHGPGTPTSERVEQLTDVYAFLTSELRIPYTLVDRGPWSGGVTPTSAILKVKLVREGLTAKLFLSKRQLLTDLVPVAAMVSEKEHGNVVHFSPSGLQPDTQYYYVFEVEGRLDLKNSGAFRTFPAPGPASFQFIFSGDARTGSTSDVFDLIREHHPLFFMNLGDFHYSDILTNSRPRFREVYDAVLASPQQSELYRRVPFAYIWDDHDFAGNNSNRKAPAQAAARLTYDEYVPHYPLPLDVEDREGGPICQSFSVGRVKFILTDLRSERDDARKRDDASKSMFGAKQKAWFKRELLAAKGRYPLIFWCSSVPWIGKAGLNAYHGLRTNQFGYIHHSQLEPPTGARTNQLITPPAEDWWSAFATERREVADFIKQNRIRGVSILHADSHMLAADDGTNSDYATGGGLPLPVMCAAPLDKEPSIKGGPYSQGIYRVRPGEGCFGLVTVNDRGDVIDVTFSGRNNKDEEKIALKFSVRSSP